MEYVDMQYVDMYFAVGELINKTKNGRATNSGRKCDVFARELGQVELADVHGVD